MFFLNQNIHFLIYFCAFFNKITEKREVKEREKSRRKIHSMREESKIKIDTNKKSVTVYHFNLLHKSFMF